MSSEKDLYNRSGSTCELCSSTELLSVFKVATGATLHADNTILICNTCKTQIENPDTVDANHWRCLNESMWSSIPAVQVMAWRMLHRLSDEIWPLDLLDQLYLDEDTLLWAKATGEGATLDESEIHKDSNGIALQTGDNIVIIKDLPVKGANFTAKRGTSVYRITLVKDNPEHIEGRINGQNIVILTKFVKKTS
jgi:protein PhnA